MIQKLYPPALERQGGAPLTLQAAKRLREVVGEGDTVLIATGMLIYPYWELGETDGPLGGAALARALQIGLDAKPVLVTDKVLTDMVTATCRGANLNVLPLKRLKEVPKAVSVVAFPVDDEEAKREARQMIETLKPKAIIAIERRGRNEKGVYHSWKGMDMNPYEAKIGTLFDEAMKEGILTIGIGDGGNEIGLGVIQDVVKEVVPFGASCQCPCGSGMADSIKVDISIVITVSNWGAYGIAACLSAMLGNPDILHNGEIEDRMLRECIDAEGIDGVTGLPEPKVDDIPGRIHSHLVDILRETIQGGLRGPK